MEEILSGTEAVARLFEELVEAIQVTYRDTYDRSAVVRDIQQAARQVRVCVALGLL